MSTKLINNFLFCFFVCLGIYLSLIGGYGSDEDTLPLIGAFESILHGEKLMASRFTPYPVAEIGIGFLSYFFGSFFANITTFTFIILGLIFFYFGVEKKIEISDLVFFLTLCLSSPVLFFDNLEPIDYSWAFLPLAIGIYCLKKNHFELAILFFSISIGTRIYFLLFVIISIYFFNYTRPLNYKKKIILIFTSFFFGGLFYLPIWFENNFSLIWLTAVTPNDQGIYGLISRFIYKIIMSFSIITFLTILFIFFIKKNNFSFKKNIFLLSLVYLNLIIFLIIPAELSYLQPMLIFTFFFLFKYLEKKFIYVLILTNLLSWIIEIQPLKIIYKSDNKCDNIQAINALVDFSIIKGRYFQFLDTRNKINCWLPDNEDRSFKILNGEPLKP
ncbi:hypothetical protein IDH01_01065 [Pelagibacterales bacterium SAG-MED08]|nr:hypothetical protein [Pelagibacterales bacterium SAG-MED08]